MREPVANPLPKGLLALGDRYPTSRGATSIRHLAEDLDARNRTQEAKRAARKRRKRSRR